MLTYNDEVLWPQNLGDVAMANYTFIIDTYGYHQIHMRESINFTNNLNKTKNKPQTTGIN